MRSTIIAFLLCLAATAAAQVSLQGIVNVYSRLISVGTANCQNILHLDDATGFNTGDRILLIQMKGAQVSYDPNNFGTVLEYGSTGLFEFATVEAVQGNHLYLNGLLQNTYLMGGETQVIRVATAKSAVINASVFAPAYDGKTGGVVVMEIQDTLLFQADINVSELGFRGGQQTNGRSACSILTLSGAENDGDLSPRGHGIADPLQYNEWGRGALANGGGGGAAHNSGGGGGGNGGLGGRGGIQWQGCSNPILNGGLGGYSLHATAQQPRAYLGGGGGTGHANDRVGTGGVRGGGIVIIRARTIIGNGHAVLANGQTVLNPAGNDGAGGGGAGGTIVIDCWLFETALRLSANGGSGGQLRTGAKHGPGGGGGGGLVYLTSSTVSPLLQITVTGGTHGINQGISNLQEAAYGALDGDDGRIISNAVVPTSVLSTPIIAVVPQSIELCKDSINTLVGTYTGGTGKVQAQWRDSRGTVLSNALSADVSHAQAPYVILSVTDSLGCQNEDTVFITIREPARIQLYLQEPWLSAYCRDSVSTRCVVKNVGAEVATISVVGTGPVVIQLNADHTLDPGDSVQIPLVIMRYGVDTSYGIVRATALPCNTVVEAQLGVAFQSLGSGITPTQITMVSYGACSPVQSDTTVHVYVENVPSAALVGALTEGSVTLRSQLPDSVFAGDSVAVRVQYAPSNQSHYGRIGIIVQKGTCIDTVWSQLSGTIIKPVLRSASTLTLPPTVGCLSQSSTDSILVSDSVNLTDWTVTNIVVSGPITTSLALGTVFRGTLHIVVQSTVTLDGPFSGSISITLAPCDTTITIVVNGERLVQQVSSTPVLQYSESAIGSTQTMTAAYSNIGTAPLRVLSVAPPEAPYTLVRTIPPLPATLAPGETLYAEVELRQEYGNHIDTLIVEIDSSCPLTLLTELRAEATTSTTVKLPTLTASVGQSVLLPITIEERPQVAPHLLTAFQTQFRVPAQQLSIQDGVYNGAEVRTVIRPDSLLVTVTGEWNGTDTLTRIPALIGLSIESEIPLTFNEGLPFAWIGVPTQVNHINGMITINDVCAGRDLRSVRLGGTIAMIRVSPIPASDYVSIRVEATMPVPLTVSMHDMISGKSVDYRDRSAMIVHTLTLDTSSLASGTYVLQIATPFERATQVVQVHH